jgi:hypothetical protein
VQAEFTSFLIMPPADRLVWANHEAEKLGSAEINEARQTKRTINSRKGGNPDMGVQPEIQYS